jgi:subtilase family serine protease
MGSIFQFSVALSYNDNLTYVSETKYVYTNVPTIATSSSNIQVGIDDQNIIAGQINNVTIKVKNTADFTAEMVTIQVAMPGSQVSSSSSSSLSSLTGITGSTSSASLVLIGADGSWSLGDIGPGEERECR